MALSHVVMHIALCNSAIRLKPGASMPVHVTVSDRINRVAVDQSFDVAREHVNTATVAFDMPWGVYKSQVALKAGHTTCTATAYFAVVADHNRTIDVDVHDRPAAPVVPALIYGAAPFAFGYAQPTVVLFDSKAAKCNAAVPDPIDTGETTENDADGYYATFFPTRTLLQHEPLVPTLRLTDARGDYHYIRVSEDFVTFSSGWPSVGSFNIDDDVMQYIASTSEDTLLCPKLHKTTTSF